MPTREPPAAFASAVLDVEIVNTGSRYGRIFHHRYPDPLGYGKTPSRFSDHRRRVDANRFGVLYLGSTFKVCFVEAILRDQRNGLAGDLPMDEQELHDRLYAEIEVIAPLTLVDLRQDGRLRMGIPSDVAGGANQTLARKWSVAINEHPSQPDGIIFPSRLNGQTNLAVYDRSVIKLHSLSARKIIAVTPDIVDVLDTYKVAIV